MSQKTPFSHDPQVHVEVDRPTTDRQIRDVRHKEALRPNARARAYDQERAQEEFWAWYRALPMTRPERASKRVRVQVALL